MIEPRPASAAYRASLATLDVLQAWCHCAAPLHAQVRPQQRCAPVTFCRTCAGLVKPADEEHAPRVTDGR